MAYAIKGTSKRVTGTEMLKQQGLTMADFDAKKDKNGNLQMQDGDQKIEATCPRIFEKREVGNLWAAEWRTIDGKFKLKSNNREEFETYIGIQQVFVKTLSFWKNPDGELVWDEFYEAWVSTGTGKYPKKTTTTLLEDVFKGAPKKEAVPADQASASKMARFRV